MGLSNLLQQWQNDPKTGPNISTWRVVPARPSVLVDFPLDLPAQLVTVLKARGIRSLYSHQAAAFQAFSSE